MADEPKRIDYSRHALQRMEQRRIPVSVVEYTIRNPSLRLPGTAEHSQRFERDFPPAKRLAVIFEEESDCLRVVTAFWM